MVWAPGNPPRTCRFIVRRVDTRRVGILSTSHANSGSLSTARGDSRSLSTSHANSRSLGTSHANSGSLSTTRGDSRSLSISRANIGSLSACRLVVGIHLCLGLFAQADKLRRRVFAFKSIVIPVGHLALPDAGLSQRTRPACISILIVVHLCNHGVPRLVAHWVLHDLAQNGTDAFLQR